MEVYVLGVVWYLAYLTGITILLFKIWRTRSCAGVSGRTQILFTVVYTINFSTIFYFTQFLSIHCVYLILDFIFGYGTLYLIFVKFKATYDSDHDTFRIEFLILPALALSIALALLLDNSGFIVGDIVFNTILWLSGCLESVAILPQLFMTSRAEETERTIFYYLIAMATQSALLVVIHGGWYFELEKPSSLLISTGVRIVQTSFYLVFFGFKIFKWWKRTQEPSFHHIHQDTP